MSAEWQYLRVDLVRGLRRRWGEKVFNRSLAGILYSPPIDYSPTNWTVVSMVSRHDLAMYLLAIKSFYWHLGAGKILIINDGSLTDGDQQVLREHLISPTIIERSMIDVGNLPRHIMWERLACVLNFSGDEYVIQLDSDTVTTGPVEIIRNAIARNRAFILDTRDSNGLTSVLESSTRAAKNPSNHIQMIMERAMVGLPSAGQAKYVRGSAGLVGLPCGGFTRLDAEAFYLKMTEFCGERILEWGSDQTAFNFIAANSPDFTLLPYPTYAVSEENSVAESAVFVHFIGTYRFERGEYSRRAEKFLAQVGISSGSGSR